MLKMFIKYLQRINDKRVKIERQYKSHRARYKHLTLYIEHLDNKEKKRIEKVFAKKEFEWGEAK